MPAHAILAILLCPSVSVSVHAEFCSVAAVVSRAAAAAASPRLPPGGARCTGRLPRARPDPQIREIRELAGRSSTHQLAIWTKRPEKLLRINSWVCLSHVINPSLILLNYHPLKSLSWMNEVHKIVKYFQLLLWLCQHCGGFCVIFLIHHYLLAREATKYTNI